MNRSVKGVYFLALIKQLKAWHRQAGGNKIPALSAEDNRSISESKIMPSSWYPLEDFIRTIDSVFHLVYGGTNEGLLQMGIDAANTAAGGPQRRIIKPGDPVGTLGSLSVYWNLSYNFGCLSLEKQKHDYCVALKEYPDIPRVHALLHIGFIQQLLTLAGTEGVVCQPTSTPWKDGNDFTIRVQWQGFK